MQVGDFYTVEMWNPLTESPMTLKMRVISVDGNTIVSEQVSEEEVI
ncbi:hypothetical protein [Bacillus sp. FJAT-18017]|nr:hypothetical protein [Bacillus sp. FJAT-18017]